MQLKIGAHTVKVIYQKLEQSTGTFDAQSLTITIDPTYPPSVQGATLLHEILHAINGTLDSTEIGHALLESLAEQLYQVLHDNKLLNEKAITNICPHQKNKKKTE